MVKRIFAWILILGLGLSPLFFLPTTQDYYDTNKWALLVVLVLVILISAAVTLLRKSSHGIPLSFSPATLAFAALTVAALISFLVASPNKIEALASPWGPVTFAALTVLFLAPAVNEQFKARLKRVWYATAVVLGLIAIYQFFGMGRVMFPSVAFLANNLWTPTGTSIATLSVLILTIPLVAGDLWRDVQKRNEQAVAVFCLLLIVLVAGAAFMLAAAVPKFGSSLLPVTAGARIAFEIFKHWKLAIAGVGADNFMLAFTAGRPVWLNTTPIWNVRFVTNASLFLHLATIYGALGVIGSILLVRSLLAGVKRDFSFASRVLCVLAILFVTPSLTLLLTVTVILLLTQPVRLIHIPVKSTVARIALAIILFILTGITLYGLGRFYVGEWFFQSSLLAMQKNDGTGTYNRQWAAIRANNYISRYHQAFSQTNLALANTLITNPPSEDKTMDDQNRQMVATLIQQAIREAKIAVALAPQNVVAWENIASTYQSLSTVTSGADTWALGAYERAEELDPTNPVVRVDRAVMLVKLQKYDEAIRVLEEAIALKPDYANAYYNLANADKQKGDTVKAAEALEKTLSLVPKDSADWHTASDELDALKK